MSVEVGSLPKSPYFVKNDESQREEEVPVDQEFQIENVPPKIEIEDVENNEENKIDGEGNEVEAEPPMPIVEELKNENYVEPKIDS